ncbi:uncharacterized protein [Acropora muricata]|uniref:uncharacterized protein n=1 Tax=Acropora muricata TaxID=159855 RepID=UPI0034E5BC58
MISSRCFRSISNLSSPAKLVRHASRIQRLVRTQGLTTQSSLSGRSTTVSQFLTTQSPFGRRFTRSLYSAVVVCDLSRIPEILANSVKEGAGLDSDMTDDDDEMSSPVKKGKHRKNPSYRYHVF